MALSINEELENLKITLIDYLEILTDVYIGP